MKDNMPEETELENPRTAFCILQESVSKDMLASLQVKVLAEQTLYGEGDDAVRCWTISATGVRKLAKHGYDTRNIIDTDLDGVKFVALTNPDGSPARHSVDPAKVKMYTVSNWNGHDSWKPALRDLLDKHIMQGLGKHVHVTVPHGSPEAANVDSSKFHVHIWSAPGPRNNERMHIPANLLGVRTFCQDSGALMPWVGGEPLVDQNGYEYGAYDANNLFVYFDLVETSCTTEHKNIVDKFLGEMVAAIKAPKGSDVELVRKRYVAACKGRANGRETELRKTMEKSEAEARRHQSELTNWIREHRVAKEQLVNISKYADSLEAELGREFDNLLKLDKIKGVNFRGDDLIIYTDNLCCRDPRTKKLHDIGAFKLQVNTKTSTLYFHNVTRKVNAFREAMNGPHLFPDGRACLGNMDEIIPKLVATYQ